MSLNSKMHCVHLNSQLCLQSTNVILLIIVCILKMEGDFFYACSVICLGNLTLHSFTSLVKSPNSQPLCVNY